jgi:cyclopropane fatty-acyl-phospholipid synthase-like methyltransferase
MEKTLKNSDIIQFLKERFKGGGFIDSLKIKYRPIVSPFIDLIQKVKPGEKVGDIGCGSGQFLLLLSEFSTPASLLGIEINARLVENANQLFKDIPKSINYKFSVFDGINFPEELKEMDRIFLIDVFHHVPKSIQNTFIKNLCAILKPGAELIFKDINGASPLVYFNKLHDLIFAGEIGNEWSMEKVKKSLTEHGLTITEQYKQRIYGYPHYTIIAKK